MEVLVAEEDRTSSSSRKNVYVCCACVRVIQGTTKEVKKCGGQGKKIQYIGIGNRVPDLAC